MQIFSTFRYHFGIYKKELQCYYPVIIAVEIFAILLSVPFIYIEKAGDGPALTTNGITAISCLAVTVTMISHFREGFAMCIQNGVSRRSQFLGHLPAAAAMCLCMAVLDEAVTLLLRLLGLLPFAHIESLSLLETTFAGDVAGLSPVVTALASVIFSFFLLLGFCGIGSFTGALFYRLNKLGKIILGVSLGAGFMIGLPLLSELFYAHPDWAISRVLLNFAVSLGRLVFSSPWNLSVTGLILFSILGVFVWLLMRRAPLKLRR